MKFRESLVSAWHNYLVNDMLSPGFVLGSPEAGDDFWFVADVVGPERREGLISARLYDGLGNHILEVRENKIAENPGHYLFQPIPDGFRINDPNGRSFLEVRTRSFTNGYVTLIHGKLYDRQSGLRMEPSYEGVKIYGEGRLALPAPYRFP